jgi:type I restriction enzyme R subunit
LNRKNNLLKAKYENDEKYARIHKRLLEQGLVSSQESRIFTFLKGLKTKVDERILQNTRLLSNEGYFNQMLMKLLIEESEEDEIDMELEDSQVINACIAKEYLNEYQGINTW